MLCTVPGFSDIVLVNTKGEDVFSPIEVPSQLALAEIIFVPGKDLPG